MQSNQVSIAGAITLWELSGRSNYQTLVDGFDNAGLSQYKPHRPTPLEALKIVLVDLFAGTRSLIRPLDGYKGFGVVYEQANGEHLTHHNDISITVTGKGPTDLRFYGTSWSQEQDIITRVTQEMFLVPQAKLAYSLKRIIESLCGVPIRESGGIYFIPDPSIPKWNQVAEVIEAAGGNTVHIIRTAIDDKAVRCVMDHVKQEIADYVAIASGEVQGGMKDKARENRIVDTEFMIQKAKWYEKEFGVLLTESTAALGELSVKLMMDGDWAALSEVT